MIPISECLSHFSNQGWIQSHGDRHLGRRLVARKVLGPHRLLSVQVRDPPAAGRATSPGHTQPPGVGRRQRTHAPQRSG